ncbi:hypothetical protein FOA52_014031 [Chlamydomonas sp. UWO 241]|nr:hypothetical protein FOA52_014031 [Chlamydomonas sp. UWO 241]
MQEGGRFEAEAHPISSSRRELHAFVGKMMKALVSSSSRKLQEFPAVAIAGVRSFIAVPRPSFTDDVNPLKVQAKDAPNTMASWNAKKAETAELMTLLESYKAAGDAKHEPYLKFHNPRTFEDMAKPVPNFRAMGLKAGEVPKFFDLVLSGRAADAAAAKDEWWAARKKEATAAAKSSGKAFPSVPLPEWKAGSPVAMAAMAASTDKLVQSMEPKRKLKADMTVTEGGKAVDLKFMSRAAASKALTTRKAEVHDRYLKLWAKKVLVAPETAVVPLKNVDAQLASKFELVAPNYAELLSAVAAGPKTLGQRVAASPAFSTFLLSRESAAVVGDFETTDAQKEGAALAAKLDDPAAALELLLGPAMTATGAAGVRLSEQVKAVTAHKYTPDRYMYAEGMKLAAKMAEEEAELAAAGVDVVAYQACPPTPAQAIEAAKAKAAASVGDFAKAKAAAGSAYGEYAVTKLQALAADPSNTHMEEILNPELVQEWLELELAELAETETSIDDAEEEELWALTMAAQLKHLQTHFGVDLPHGTLAYMDPILVKKIDFETTHGLDDWDTVLEDCGSEYAKEQWGVESLSHHFLPLIRYRRAKARAANGKWDAEASSVVRH